MQFNVMIHKDGYKPFFYVVQKKHYKETKKDKEIRTSVKLTPHGKLLTPEDFAKNTSVIPPIDNDLAQSASKVGLAVTTIGGAAAVIDTATIISAGGISGAITSALAAPMAVVLVEPAIGINMAVDLASGALLDLTPNPMLVRLEPEEDGGDSKKLIAAFYNSRENKGRNAD